MTAVDTPAPADAGHHKEYGFSVLVTGFARVWRAPLAIWAAIVVNAAAQALLIAGDPVPQFSGVFLLLALLSAVIAIICAAVVSAAALEAVAGRVRLTDAVARARRHLGLFAAWFAAVLVAVLIGASLWSLPGILVAVVTPFVPLAAMDGHRNALLADLRAIGSRWLRWLVTSVIMGIVVAVSWVLAALSAFFITGWPSALIVWIWFGFLYAWFQCAWAVLFRSTPIGHLPAQ